MKIEQQVCSLELSKRLKELGVKQESLWYWVLTDLQQIELALDSRGYQLEGGYIRVPTLSRPEDYGYREVVEKYSAFTVAELGEILPNDFGHGESFNGETTEYDEWGLSFKSYKVNNIWCCDSFDDESDVDYVSKADTEANARAKMLIYLLENKLITL